MKSEQYKDKQFAQYYQGLVSGSDDEKAHLPEIVEPTIVLSDYEPALMGGLSMIFPTAQIVGCWFHYSQAVFKYMSGLGLKEQYSKNPVQVKNPNML